PSTENRLQPAERNWEKRGTALLGAGGAHARRGAFTAGAAVTAAIGDVGFGAARRDVAEALREVADPVAERPRERAIGRAQSERAIEATRQRIDVVRLAARAFRGGLVR